MEPSTVTVQCPIEVQWICTKAELEALKTSEDGCLVYSLVYVNRHLGVKYDLKIYPNGSNSDRRGETRIYFFVDPGEAKEVKAQFTLSIASINYSQAFTQLFKTAVGYGTTICETRDFFDPDKKYFYWNEFTLGMKGVLEYERTSVLKIPISMTWKIKESDLIKHKNSTTDGFLRSKRLCIPNIGIRYHLTLFPNGHSEQRRGKVTLFLGFEVDHRPVEAYFRFTIDSVYFSQFWCILYKDFNGQGGICCTTDQLFDPSKGYIVNGEMVVGIQGFVLIEPRRTPLTVMKCSNGIAPKKMKTQKDKRFTIIAGEKEIKIHKDVLINTSPIFAQMIESAAKGRHPNQLQIPDFSFEVVSVATNLIYSTGFSRKFSFEDMVSLLHFADRYDIKFMKDLTQEYLAKVITASNVCQLVKISSSYNAAKLREKCIQFILKCSKDNVPVTDLDSLDMDFRYDIFMGTFCNSSDTEIKGEHYDSVSG